MLTELANLLSDITDTADGIRDVLVDAGLASRHVALDGSPYDMWKSALEFADHQGALPNVLSVMRGRYPGNHKLFDAETRYWNARARVPVSGNGPSGSEVFSQLAVINVRLMYIDRRIQENAGRILGLENRREWEWARFLILVGASAALSSVLTVILSRLS